VGRTTDETVETLLADVEIYVQTIYRGAVDVISQNVLDHLFLHPRPGVIGSVG
jgi:hypothetical protein